MGVRKIGEMRKELVTSLWLKRDRLKDMTMEDWIGTTSQRLQLFNEYLYKAYKEEYVRQVYTVNTL